jgi:hypothetical protein
MKLHTLNEAGVGFAGGQAIARTRCGVGGTMVWRDERRQLLTSANYLMPLVKLGRVATGPTILEAAVRPVEAPTCKSCLRTRTLLGKRK